MQGFQDYNFSHTLLKKSKLLYEFMLQCKVALKSFFSKAITLDFAGFSSSLIMFKIYLESKKGQRLRKLCQKCRRFFDSQNTHLLTHKSGMLSLDITPSFFTIKIFFTIFSKILDLWHFNFTLIHCR